MKCLNMTREGGGGHTYTYIGMGSNVEGQTHKYTNGSYKATRTHYLLGKSEGEDIKPHKDYKNVLNKATTKSMGTH